MAYLISLERRFISGSDCIAISAAGYFLGIIDRFVEISATFLERMAGTTGLEPAASAVTGQRSNQLNYVPTRQINEMRNRQGLCGLAQFA